jgi:hypothetical protein
MSHKMKKCQGQVAREPLLEELRMPPKQTKGRQGEPTSQKWSLSTHHVKYRMETRAMRLAIRLLEKETSMAIS